MSGADNSNGELKAQRSRRLLMWRLFLSIFLTYVVFINFFGWNESSGLAMTRSLVDQGRLEIDSYCNLPGAGERRFFEFTGDRAYYKGHFYSTRAPLGPIIAIPAYTVYRTYYLLRHGHNVIGTGFPEKFAASALFVVTMSTSAFFGALLALLIFDLSRHFIKTLRNRVLVTCLFAFGTLIFNFATVAFPHTPSAFFVFLSFYLLYELNSKNGKRQIKAKPRLAAFLSAASFGCAVLHHYLVATMGLAFLFYVALSKMRKVILIPWLLGGILTASLFGLYNYEIFGTPFDWTQNHEDNQIFTRGKVDKSEIAKKESLIKYAPKIQWTISDRLIQVFRRISKRPMLMRQTRLLIYPYRGLLLYNSILIFSFVGLVDLFRRDKLLSAVILFAFASNLFFNALHTDWWGGGSFGPRFLVPTIPLLFVGLLAFLQWAPTTKNPRIWFGLFGTVLVFNTITILSGLRDWVYHVGQPLDSNAKIMINALRNHKDIMLDFSLPNSPLFTTYVPGLFSDGVRSVILEGIYGTSWAFPRNVIYLAIGLAVIWIPLEKITSNSKPNTDES